MVKLVLWAATEQVNSCRYEWGDKEDAEQVIGSSMLVAKDQEELRWIQDGAGYQGRKISVDPLGCSQGTRRARWPLNRKTSLAQSSWAAECTIWQSGSGRGFMEVLMLESSSMQHTCLHSHTHKEWERQQVRDTELPAVLQKKSPACFPLHLGINLKYKDWCWCFWEASLQSLSQITCELWALAFLEICFFFALGYTIT